MTNTEAVMNLLRKVPLFANLKAEERFALSKRKNGGWRLAKCSLRGRGACGAFLCSPRGRNERVERTRPPRYRLRSQQTRRVFWRSPDKLLPVLSLVAADRFDVFTIPDFHANFLLYLKI
jgi:hypothetical protein